MWYAGAIAAAAPMKVKTIMQKRHRFGPAIRRQTTSGRRRAHGMTTDIIVMDRPAIQMHTNRACPSLAVQAAIGFWASSFRGARAGGRLQGVEKIVSARSLKLAAARSPPVLLPKRLLYCLDALDQLGIVRAVLVATGFVASENALLSTSVT